MKAGDEVLRSNEDLVMVFEPAKIDDVTSVVQFVGIVFSKVE